MKKIALLAFAFLFTLTAMVSVFLWPDRSLTWQQEAGYRWAKLTLPWTGRSGFQQLPSSQTNISFSNQLSNELITSNEHLLNGSGVTLGDVDGDGLTDVYLCRLDGPNALYKNLGNWKFLDITQFAGVACAGEFSTGTALADLDGDMDLDLLVTTLGGPNFCFMNNGDGTFTDATLSSGLMGNSGATTMALADIDGDSDLDLYVANYKKHTIRDLYLPQELEFDRVVKKVRDGYEVIPEFRQHYSVWQTDNGLLMRYENAEPDRLYLNDGGGRFEPVPLDDGRFLDEDGNAAPEFKEWGLTARFQDMDADGDPDLYVCNDFESPDRIWINDGHGRFRAISKLAIRNTSWATMGIDFSDIDRDGDLDFFLLDMLSRDSHRRKTQRENMIPIPHSVGLFDNRPQNSRNTLFLNRGDGTYAEIAQFSGLQASDWSWSPLFLDVDLDGYEDMIVATGHFYDALDLDALDQSRTTRYASLDAWRARVLGFPELKTTNFAFRNGGDLRFNEVSQDWGFSGADISHGLASADLDNDGDLDLVMNRLNDKAAIYQNQTLEPRIAIRLRGQAPNTMAIGAKIQVLGGPAPQSKEVISGGTYLSSSDRVYTFAASETAQMTIIVIWRTGESSVIDGAEANRIYVIDQSQAVQVAPDAPPQTQNTPYFEDVSNQIDHYHHDNEYDDFRDQPLLPKKLSQLGPGVTWFDFDDDGDDDLFIGSGQGGRMACFQNDGNGAFQPLADLLLSETNDRDQSAVLGWKTAGGIPSMVVGFSSLENGTQAHSTLAHYEVVNGVVRLRDRLTDHRFAFGPMSMADYDSDGDLDLFVGGRAVPDRYPEPASSKFYRNEAGEFRLDSLNSHNLENVGLVSGAVFSDLDGDADSDLVLAVEWGPVMVFQNEGGTFSDATMELGLSNYPGWWQGVTTGDLNEDGRLDIVATNWGLNSPYQDQYDEDRSLRLYFDDFDNNGTLDLVEAFFAEQMKNYTPVRNFDRMSRAMPYLRKRIATHQQYAQANVQEVVGFKAKQASMLEANTLAHTLFLNRDGRFEPVQLPDEAQFSPGFYCGIADFDGDGHEDIFVTQNFFSLETGQSRLDAGRGLWMKGDGTASLVAVPGQSSGIKVYGEQRGAALSDFDADGRVDLAVSQNGSATKLYRNVGAQPGLRIRLSGPPGNPTGVGATIRLVYENGLGPARHIHLGSGYWSQDSAVQILGMQSTAVGIRIRWPGGQIVNVVLPKGVLQVTAKYDGTVELR